MAIVRPLPVDFSKAPIATATAGMPRNSNIQAANGRRGAQAFKGPGLVPNCMGPVSAGSLRGGNVGCPVLGDYILGVGYFGLRRVALEARGYGRELLERRLVDGPVGNHGGQLDRAAGALEPLVLAAAEYRYSSHNLAAAGWGALADTAWS